MGAGCGYALVQQAGPVEPGIPGSNFIQRAHDVVECVRDNFGRTAFAAVEAAAEIVERALAVSALADGGIHFEPDQFAFGIVIEAAAPARPLPPRHAQNLHRAGGVFEGAPVASGAVVEFGGGASQSFAILLGRPQSAAGRKQGAKIFREAFVHPQQIADHGFLIVGRGEARGTAILAVPGVREFVRHQVGEHEIEIGIEQRASGGRAIVRFVMLQAVASDHVAQGVKEMILAVMARAEKGSGFGDEFLIGGEFFRLHRELGFAVGDDVHDVHGSFAGLGQFDLAVEQAGDQRRIDQRGERCGRELYFVSGGARYRECSSEFPVRGQGYGRSEFDGV